MSSVSAKQTSLTSLMNNKEHQAWSLDLHTQRLRVHFRAFFFLRNILALAYTFLSLSLSLLTGSPLRGEDVAVYVFDINQPSLPTPLYSVLVSISVFMALFTEFHSINSPSNFPLSHSVLPVLFLPYWFFQLYISS